MIRKYRDDKSSATHIRLGVGLILYSEKSLLLEQRIDCKKWGLIGGSVEIGERVETSITRECLEETGISIEENQLSLLGIYSDVNQYRIIHYPDNCFHAIDVIYSCKISKDYNIKKSEESIDISFFQFNKLPENIVPCALDPIVDFINLLDK